MPEEDWWCRRWEDSLGVADRLGRRPFFSFFSSLIQPPVEGTPRELPALQLSELLAFEI